MSGGGTRILLIDFVRVHYNSRSYPEAMRQETDRMHSTRVTRRDLLTGTAATLALGLIAAPRSAHAAGVLTVQQVLDRMKLHVGGPWREGGVDRIIAGSADTVVKGIGTTMMATFDALKDAVKAGTNLIITHEPTFWSHQDVIADLAGDPLLRAKQEYIRDHDLVCYHFHDHWHALRPVDGINYGMQQKMGWTGYMDADNQRIFNLPPTTLLELAKDLREKLGATTLRVVGDPGLTVRRVYESWGNSSLFPGVNFLGSDVDALVIGEAQDWDLVEYAQDIVASGQKKALIVLGHVRSEMFGMQFCAEWLKGFVPEVPVRFIPTVEPYWFVEHPPARTAAAHANALAVAIPSPQAPAADQASVVARPPLHTGPVTALQLTSRIREKLGVPATAAAADYVVAGDPTTAVTGIATTAIATLDCLKKAAAANLNLIVTLESTFWSDTDNLDRLEGDATFKAKRDFIREHKLVCFHLRSRWPATGPNGIAAAMAGELGWNAFAANPEARVDFTLPATTLLDLARELGAELNDRTLRVVGDPALPVTRVAAKWGNASRLPAIRLLNGPADVVIVGYAHEWEAVEYTQDMISNGARKGLILLGEGKSQDAGMKGCAEWLKTFITEVPIGHVALAEPYWNLQHPGMDVGTGS